jgi:hypothetical protein
MKRTATFTLTLAMLAACVGLAAAHPYAPRVDRRQWRQEIRIRDGWRGGQLTRREAYRLRLGERAIRRMEWRAKRDGRMSARERWRLERALDRQSARIWRLRHNGRVRIL